jgi:MFS family permease
MTPGTGRVFYGWFALVGTMFVIFVMGGAFVNSFGVFLPVICDEFGWSRAAVAAGLSIGFLAFGLPSPLWGIFVAKFGPRINIVLGNLLAALGLAGMSLVQEVWHVYLCYFIIGLGAGLGGYIAGTSVVSNWFIKKRSLALGMFMACGGLGGFVFPPMVTALISSVGWQMSWLVLAGIVIIVAVLIGGLVLIRNRPEDMGLVPDGISAEPFVEAGTTENRTGTGERQMGWQAKQVLQVPTTWLIGAFTATGAFTLGTMTTHQVAYLRDLGFSPMTAAMTMSLVSVSSIIGSLGFGTLALRFNIRYLASVSFGFQLMALAILLTTEELTILYIYAVLLGIGNGALLTALPTFVGAYYGRDHYAQVLGVVYPSQVIAQATAAAVAGAIYDATSAYTIAFATVAVFSLVGLICAFLARKPRLPQFGSYSE